jgi:hypothetical protein
VVVMEFKMTRMNGSKYIRFIFIRGWAGRDHSKNAYILVYEKK